MRNFKCSIADMRKQVFAEVARLAYEGGDYRRMEKLPYKIVPGEVGNQRESIFLERAIVGERIRLAMGLPLRPVAEHSLLSDGVEESAIAEKYYDPPLVNIIKYACNGCTPTHYEVTNACQGCLARHCQNACPKGAIAIERGQAHIDQDKCIKCGKCRDACSYHAIIKFTRPCHEACGMNAIGQDEYGHAKIDYDKCVSCGMCLVNCPFGAIVDKGQLFQLIHAIRRGDEVVAVIAPAFWGQFGDNVTPGQIKAAMQQLGFAALEEVAVGADLCAVEEAEEFLRMVPEKQPFMATSCCPAWSVMAKKEFPGFAPYISMTMTPMVLTARLQKRLSAALRQGITRIVNAARLRLKESDRLESTAAMLRALGAQVEVHDSGLTVTGRKVLTGGTVDPQHDHRIAMAAAAAASGCTAPVTVRDCACTDKSYPRFWTDLSALKTVPAAENTELE